MTGTRSDNDNVKLNQIKPSCRRNAEFQHTMYMYQLGASIQTWVETCLWELQMVPEKRPLGNVQSRPIKA